MSYIDDIFRRAKLQSIRGYLLEGLDDNKLRGEGYEARLEEAETNVISLITEHYPDLRAQERIMDGVDGYVSETRNAYTEVALRCGARLMYELLASDVSL